MNEYKIYNCIVVDDEMHCIDTLKQYISKIPYLNLLKEYSNSLDAAREIFKEKEQIDLLFLDIDMPKLSGLELAALIRKKVDKLIFVTGHSKYSLEAYDVLCNQYLLKPFSFNGFNNTVNKLIEVPVLKRVAQRKDFIFIKDSKNSQYVKVKLSEIICIKALEHYIIISAGTVNYTHHITLREAERLLLVNEGFIRIHKSYIISKEHIIAVKGNIILMSNNLTLEIGNTYKQEFKSFLDKNNFH